MRPRRLDFKGDLRLCLESIVCSHFLSLVRTFLWGVLSSDSEIMIRFRRIGSLTRRSGESTGACFPDSRAELECSCIFLYNFGERFNAELCVILSEIVDPLTWSFKFGFFFGSFKNGAFFRKILASKEITFCVDFFLFFVGI